MWDLAGGLIAALLAGFTLGWWLSRRRRSGGRMFYAEWGSSDSEPGAGPAPPAPGDES